MKYPDYNSRQSLSLNTPHEIPNDGWVQTGITNNGPLFRVQLCINGALVAYNRYQGSGYTEMIPVKAGDVVRCDSQYSGGSGFLFYFPVR